MTAATPATPLPTFIELAEQRIADASPRDKTISIKISINTARMMIESESAYPRLLHEREQLVAALRKCVAASDQFVRDTGLRHGDLITDATDDARALLRQIEGAE